MRLFPLALFTAAVSLLVAGAALAQPSGSRVAIAPVSGVAVYAADSVSQSGVVARPALGGEIAVGLAPSWGAALRYQTLAPGGGNDRVHSVALAVRRAWGGEDGPRAVLGVGGHLTDTFRGNRAIGYGPVAEVGVDLPLTSALSLGVSSSTALVLPDGAADARSGGLGFDLLANTAATLRLQLGRGCTLPTLDEVRVPTTLLRYEPGTFSVRAPDDAVVVWEFEGLGAVDGRTVTQAFVEPGPQAYRLTVAACGEAVVLEGSVDIEALCLTPPSVQMVGGKVDDTGVSVFRAVADGTPPLRYQWTYRGVPIDSTREEISLLTGLEEPGTHPLEVAVSNCTGQIARDQANVVIEPDSSLTFTLGFAFNQCCPPQSARAASLLEPPEPEESCPSPDRALRQLVRAQPILGQWLLDLRAALADTTGTSVAAGRVLVVEGYADFIDAPYNRALALARAHAVGQFFQAILPTRVNPALAGVLRPYPEGRLLVLGRGQTRTPTCNGVLDPGCVRQRRVDVSFQSVAWAASAYRAQQQRILSRPEDYRPSGSRWNATGCSLPWED